MALSGKDLAIETPCPIDLDRSLSDGRKRNWDCAHCSKTVHVLSSMTEREARSFLHKHEGETLCITYLEGEDGEIRFQPERNVVPLGRLTRSTRRRPAAAAAAVGFAAALAACTPTDNDEVRRPDPVQEAVTVKAEVDSPHHGSMANLIAEAREKAEEDKAKIEPEPDSDPEPEVEAEPIRDPKAIPRPGGIRVPPVPPAPTATPKVVHKRGGISVRKP